jgi:hypothetical protein
MLSDVRLAVADIAGCTSVITGRRGNRRVRSYDEAVDLVKDYNQNAARAQETEWNGLAPG